MSYKDQGGLLSTLIPSVFIDNITLETGGRPPKLSNPHVDHKLEDNSNLLNLDVGVLDLTIDCSIKEIISGEPISQWFNSEFSKYVIMSVIVTTNKTITAAMSSSNDGINLINSRAKFLNSSSPAIKTLKAAYPNTNLDKIISDFAEIKDFNIYSDVTHDQLASTQHSSYVGTDGEIIHDINFRAKFSVVGENPEHLSIFAVTRLDIDQLIEDYNLSVDDATLSSQNGKITSEIVIDRGSTIGESFVFTKVSDGTPWLGAVHDNGRGNWATGDLPSEESELLRFNKVNNNKIQDFRKIEEINKLEIDMSDIQNKIMTPELQKYSFLKKFEQKMPRNIHFSELYLARDRDGNARMTFAVDYMRVLRETSLFPKLYSTATKQQKAELASSCKIRSLRLMRRRVKPVNMQNALGNPTQGEVLFDRGDNPVTIASSSESSLGIFKKVETDMGSMREAFYTLSNNTLPVRFFAATDTDISLATDGIYQYGVEMVVEDASQKYLFSLIRLLRMQRNKLHKYYLEGTQIGMNKYIVELQDPHIDESRWERARLARDNNVGNFTPSSGRFTKKFARQQYKKYESDLARAPWISCVLRYFEVLNIFTGYYSSGKKAMEKISILSKYADPKSGSPKGVMAIIKIMDNLISRASLIAGSDVPLGEGESKLYRSSGNSRTSKYPTKTTTIQNWFTDSNFDTNQNSRFGFDYLSNYRSSPIRYRNLRVVSGDELKGRVRDEFLRYFRKENSPVDIKGITNNDSYLTTGFGYLSPGVALLGTSKVSFGQATPDERGDLVSPQQYAAIEAAILTHKSFGAPYKFPQVAEKSKLSPEAQLYKGSVLDYYSKFNMTIIPNLQDIPKSLSDRIASAFRKSTTIDACDDVRESLPNDTRIDPVVSRSDSETTYLDSVKSDINPNSLLLNIQHELRTASRYYDGSTASPFGKKKTKTISSGSKKSLSSGKIKTGTTKSFNLNEQANVINWLYKSEEYLLETTKIHNVDPASTVAQVVRFFPNQIKSLLSASVSPSNVITNWHQLSENAIEDAQTSAKYSFMYNLINKIEVLTAYNRDTKTPVWKVLTHDFWEQSVGQEMICRMLPYEAKIFGISRPKSMQIPTYDEYFILKPKRLSNYTNGIIDDLGGVLGGGYVITVDDLLDSAGAVEEWVVSNIGTEVPTYPDGTPSTNHVGGVEPSAASYPCGDLLQTTAELIPGDY